MLIQDSFHYDPFSTAVGQAWREDPEPETAAATAQAYAIAMLAEQVGRLADAVEKIAEAR
jgi:hypothetical protein